MLIGSRIGWLSTWLTVTRQSLVIIIDIMYDRINIGNEINDIDCIGLQVLFYTNTNFFFNFGRSQTWPESKLMRTGTCWLIYIGAIITTPNYLRARRISTLSSTSSTRWSIADYN